MNSSLERLEFLGPMNLGKTLIRQEWMVEF